MPSVAMSQLTRVVSRAGLFGAVSQLTRVVSRVGLFGLGSAGFGPKVDKIYGLAPAWDELFVLGAQKYNQNNLASLLNFSELT